MSMSAEWLATSQLREEDMGRAFPFRDRVVAARKSEMAPHGPLSSQAIGQVKLQPGGPLAVQLALCLLASKGRMGLWKKSAAPTSS